MIGSTPLPGSGGGSGPAYDDTAVRERLDVLEANRSASPAYRPELRSRVGGLTLQSSVYDLVPINYFFVITAFTDTGNQVRIDASGGTIAHLLELMEIYDFEGFLEGFLEDGHLVIRPRDATRPLVINSSFAQGALEAFEIDDTWFSQPVYPRPAGMYDSTSTNVRLVGPPGAYAPGSGLSVSTALEALKRLHHARDIVVEDRQFYAVPDGLDPDTATLGDIGAAVGQAANLYWTTGNMGENGEAAVVTDLNETAVSFISRIPGIAFAFSGVSGVGRRQIEFYTDGDFWHMDPPIHENHGYVWIIGNTPIQARVQRLMSRLHSDDVFLATQYYDPVANLGAFASGQLSNVVGSILLEIQSLRSRVAELEARP